VRTEPATVYRLSATLQAVLTPTALYLQRNLREPLVVNASERKNLLEALQREAAL